VRKGIILAVGGWMLLTGCGNQGNKASSVPAPPKWQGAPYHISFDTGTGKPNPAGITIPAIKYTANPDELERRACLLVRFDASGEKKDASMMNQMVVGPMDISGAEGTLPAEYMDAADQGLAKLLGAYGAKGKVKVSVLLARSSISSQPGDDEIEQDRLSDWTPIELDFKGSHRGR